MNTIYSFMKYSRVKNRVNIYLKNPQSLISIKKYPKEIQAPNSLCEPCQDKKKM